MKFLIEIITHISELLVFKENRVYHGFLWFKFFSCYNGPFLMTFLIEVATHQYQN